MPYKIPQPPKRLAAEQFATPTQEGKHPLLPQCHHLPLSNQSPIAQIIIVGKLIISEYKLP